MTDSSQPPRKRTRSDTKNATAEYSTYTKDADLYFPDGNICFAVERYLFRLHRGVVARQAEAFRAMLDIPEPAGGQALFEGVPVVDLYDNKEDIKALFSIIYDGPYVFHVCSF